MSESETAVPQRHEAPSRPAPEHDGSVPTMGGSAPTNGEAPSEDEVLEALKSVIDPELGINIVDLGLVYEVDVAEDGGVDIQYTLTTMGCPIGPLIEDQMRAFLAPVHGIGEVRPEMVLRPAWTPEMMSDEAKAALGMF
jgi:metal-sulfur cluster biosynthetic enzyme